MTRMDKKRVRFSKPIATGTSTDGELVYVHHDPMDGTSSSCNKEHPSSRWYTSQELRAIRREIQSIVAMKNSGRRHRHLHDQHHHHHHHHHHTKTTNDTGTMRGLEFFQSTARRELQTHFVRSVIEAQRRIKRKRKQEGNLANGDKVRGSASLSSEESILLQQVAEKFSKYARDRAHEIGIRDAEDSCRLHQQADDKDSCVPSSFGVKKATTHTKTATLSNSSSIATSVVLAGSRRIQRPSLPSKSSSSRAVRAGQQYNWLHVRKVCAGMFPLEVQEQRVDRYSAQKTHMYNCSIDK